MEGCTEVLDCVGYFLFWNSGAIHASAWMSLSVWRAGNCRLDNKRKSLGHVVFRERVPRAANKLAGLPGYNSIELAVIVDW